MYVLRSILGYASHELCPFARAVGWVRHAVGDPPEEWRVGQLIAREHSEYALSCLGVLLERGLVVVGDWPQRPEDQFVPWQMPVSSAVAEISRRYSDVPADRPLLFYDVAAFADTPKGREALEAGPEILDEVATKIEADWQQVDEEYGRSRPAVEPDSA